MSKIAYFIFLLPLTGAAMQSGKPLSPNAQRLIAVANILRQGVTAQVDESSKVWIRKDTLGHLVVPPLKYPRITHSLLVKDTDETQTLAEVFFTDSTGKFFVVYENDKSEVFVKEATQEDIPSSGPQMHASKEFVAMLQTHGPVQDASSCDHSPK